MSYAHKSASLNAMRHDTPKNGLLSTGNDEQLINGKTLLLKLFDDEARPSARWLERKVQNGVIPCHRVSRLKFFKLSEVAAAMKGGRL